jgi:Ca2+-binding EF-hand superfamily protein
MATHAALVKAFSMFDTDKSGCINASELKNVLLAYYKDTNKPIDQGTIDTAVKEFLAYVDKNNDGKVTQDEFVKFFEQLMQ